MPYSEEPPQQPTPPDCRLARCRRNGRARVIRPPAAHQYSSSVAHSERPHRRPRPHPHDQGACHAHSTTTLAAADVGGRPGAACRTAPQRLPPARRAMAAPSRRRPCRYDAMAASRPGQLLRGPCSPPPDGGSMDAPARAPARAAAVHRAARAPLASAAGAPAFECRRRCGESTRRPADRRKRPAAVHAGRTARGDAAARCPQRRSPLAMYQGRPRRRRAPRRTHAWRRRALQAVSWSASHRRCGSSRPWAGRRSAPTASPPPAA